MRAIVITVSVSILLIAATVVAGGGKAASPAEAGKATATPAPTPSPTPSTLDTTIQTVGDLVQIIFVDKADNPANATGACASPGADNLGHGLTGYKLGSSALAYKTKTSTFPTNVASSEVQSAINAAFTTVDGATSKALFTNGGTTTAALNKKDGTNAVGFGSLNSGTVGTAYAWYSSKTKEVVEFDIILSTAYKWATNAGKTGACGGAADAFDIQDIMTHEVGHPVGLNDVTTISDNAQSMYGYGAKGELYKRDLAGGDKKGITTMYGQ
jgi:hypothetical protein